MEFETLLQAKKSHTNGEKPLRFGTQLCTPVVITGAVLLCISYITDIISAGAAEVGVGETSAVSRFLFDTASLVNKLIYPLISAGIALAIGGFSALSGGLLGGMLAGTGANLITANANITSISGVFGSILAGYIAGYSVRTINKLHAKKQKEADLSFAFLTPAVSIIITLFAVFTVNTVSYYINYFSSVLLGVAGKSSEILLSVILGIFMTADSGGPLYLASYVFGVASIPSGDPYVMAAVIAAGAIPPLCMGLYTLIYKERVEKREQLTGAVGIVGGLLGIPQCALPFYAEKTYRFVIACVPGGITASVLSVAFRCSCEIPAGGILAFSFEDRPLFFILALVCGALISTLLLSLLEKPENSTDTQNEEDKNLAPEGAAA